MALYLGGDRVTVNLDGVLYHLNLYTSIPITNGRILLSSDGRILIGSDITYLTVKEDE